MASRLSTVFWIVVVLAHVVAAALWWWVMPAGFPISHPRFWLHRVVPVVILAFAVVCVIPRARPLRPALLAAVPATYVAAAIAGRLLFPVTLARWWLAPLGGGITLLVVWTLQHRAAGRRAVAFAFLGVVLGTFLAFAQTAPSPSTHPSNVARPSSSENASTSLSFDAGTLSLTIFPRMQFVSRSPDGCWTLLASTADRLGPVNERSTLTQHTDDRGNLVVEATTDVPHDVYTHLNAYAGVAIAGHRRLFLSFSPAPDARIEVLWSDYPRGRPARFAYVDAERVFHVVEAADAEKGPFEELASGRLAPTDALSVTFYDEQTPLARITFEDFAAQASTELSPTAGWGVPQNAISFSLMRDAKESAASIFVTLAGTGVGRGFESVAHAAGVYRNRLRVERL